MPRILKKGGARRAAKKIVKNIPYGQVHIYATFNNTIISITDQSGNVVAWASAGTSGFKGSRKSTPYAARLAAQSAASAAHEHGMQEVGVFVRGPGPGREAAIRAIQSSGLKVRSITKETPTYNELLEYLVQKATPQEILDFRLPETAQKRAEYLTEQNKAGVLTPEEKLELEQMIEFDQVVSLLKANATQVLN